MVIGIWQDRMRYKVIDEVTGRSEVVTIMGTAEEYNDPVQMQEYEHRAQERVADGWRKPVTPRMNKTQRADLAGVLHDIHDSHLHYAESLHGRYWGKE